MKPIDRTEAERLVQTYSDMILRLSYTYLKSTQDAEDICQTVFLKLLTGGMVFDSPEHEKAWILRTAANACKDALRAAHRRCVGLEAVAEAAAPEPPDSAVLDAVMALPEKYREAVYLYYYEGYSVREVAALLGRSEAAAGKACGKHLEASFMNREYNDNREYKNALDELHFSEEAKNRMVERLMERAEQPAPRRVRRFPRIAAVGVAAALVLSIGAGASGVLKSASEVFAGVFGPTADTEIIDQIGRPIGASDTSNGVTVTADAILFDGYNYLISYTLEKDDGSAFECTKNPDTGLYDLYWKRSDSTIGRGVDGASGSSYFYDENPSDNAIQYVETMSYNDAVQTGGTVKITLGDLCVLNSENGEPTTIAKGAWRLKFQLEAGNSAVELPAGQNIDVNGRSAAVDTIVLSPIGYHVVYTVDGEATFDTLYDENGEEVLPESGREPAGVCSTWESYAAKLLVTKTDGTVLDFSDFGGSMDPHDGKTVCTRQGTFDTVIPLDDIASVTIGDVSIPIE